jgi:hypothetical protein
MAAEEQRLMSQTEDFTIGTVSRLTGISQHTLRVWERRYGAVESRRSDSGRRLYSDQDVEKLTLLKALVDRGDRIGKIAGEDIESLRARLASYEDHSLTTRQVAAGPAKIAVFGPTLAETLRDAPLPGSKTILAEADFERFQTDAALGTADALILEFSLLEPGTPDTVARLRRSTKTDRVVVVYGFGRSADVEHLVNSGVRVLRAPAELHAIAALIDLPAGGKEEPAASESTQPSEPLVTDMEVPPRKLSPQALQRLARVSTTVECECPHHLVDLVRNLTAFEIYSGQCRNRNEKDAALHAYLHIITARARALMEEACIRAAEADGIEI